MKVLDIDTLLALCIKEHKNGNGKRKIMISNDDEGNGYHGLFFGFTPTKEFGFGGKFAPTLPYGVNNKEAEDNYIILG